MARVSSVAWGCLRPLRQAACWTRIETRSRLFGRRSWAARTSSGVGTGVPAQHEPPLRQLEARLGEIAEAREVAQGVVGHVAEQDHIRLVARRRLAQVEQHLVVAVAAHAEVQDLDSRQQPTQAVTEGLLVTDVLAEGDGVPEGQDAPDAGRLGPGWLAQAAQAVAVGADRAAGEGPHRAQAGARARPQRVGWGTSRAARAGPVPAR